MKPRFTRTRNRILSIVRQSPVPVSAQQVYRVFDRGSVDLVTVYRGLQFLEDTERVASFSLRCEEHGTVRYFYSEEAAHLHFFHCEACHIFIPYHDCYVEDTVRSIEEKYQYSIHRHVLYFTGLCGNCRTEQARES